MKPWMFVMAAAISGSAIAASEDAKLRDQAAKLFGRIEAPVAAKISTAEVALGRALFWDTRISLDGKTACASCHPAEDFGADRRAATREQGPT